MRYTMIIGFAVMVFAQWYAPLSMIIESEKTIDDGVEYKFRTRPVDPSDPFRGKYITLDYDMEVYHPSDTNELNFREGSLLYATVGTGDDGFARIEKLSEDLPESDEYFALEFRYRYDTMASLTFPFKRFYLEESKASEAEQLYWSSRRDSSVVCYAKVKMLNGDAKLIDVMVNDSSIVDIVRRINADKVD